MEGRMDDPELTPVLLILKDWEAISLDTKEEKHCPEIKAETNSEMNCHQESGDTGPTLEQGAESKKSILGKEEAAQPIPTNQGGACLRQTGVMDPSQQAPVSGNVRNSAALRKTSHRCIQRGQEPHRANQPFLSLQPPMASCVEHANEPDAIEEAVSWINPRTGKVMKCRSQQTSWIWQLKPLCAILQASAEEPQASRNSQELHSTNQEQALQSGVGPSQLERRHPGKAQEISQEPQNHSEDGSASQETPQASQVRPTVVTGTKRVFSKKTGLELVSSTQQTSLVWEKKPLSAILQPAVQQPRESQESNKEESKEKVTFSEAKRSGKITVLYSDLKPEESPTLVGGREPGGCQESEGQKVWDSTKQPNGQSSPDGAGVKRDHTWVNQRSGVEMKCKAEQTNSTWEIRPLSEILQVSGQESQQKRDKVSRRAGRFGRDRSDPGSKVNREMTLSFSDEEETGRTYSIISLERGILLNKKTRKILINRGQQTVEALPATTFQITLDNYRRKGYQTVGVNEMETTVEENEGGSSSRGQQTIIQWVRSKAPRPMVHADSSFIESYETFVTSNHPSEDVLFKLESSMVFLPVDEDDLLLIYGKEDSEKEGSFINNQTGKVLESQCLQTEEIFFHEPDLEDKEPGS